MAVADVEAAKRACAEAVETRLACGRERWRAQKEQARARRAVARARELRPRIEDFVELVDPAELMDVIVGDDPRRL